MLYDFYTGETVDENVFAYSNRAGDQCGLVLYHNRYATTAGWINESAAYAVKGDGEAVELRRMKLSQALGLVDEPGVYYAFRDHTLGLIFLRSSSELSEKGLYAELGEYEFHVFTDFREIRDDADGTWGGLCTALAGRGVESLDDELKQLQYAGMNAAFRTVLEMAPVMLGSSAAQRKGIVSASRRFLAALSVQTGTPAAQHAPVLQELSRCLEFLNALPSLKPSARPAAALLSRLAGLLTIPTTLQLLVAWLLLRERLPKPDSFGLDYSLRLAGGGGNGLEGRHACELLSALLACKPAGDIAASVRNTFSMDACRTFMLVHESAGVEWFNQEHYEELLTWYLIIDLVGMASIKSAPRTISARLGRLASEARRLEELGVHTGYRVKLLLRLLEPVAPGATAGKDTKKVRKNTDVQSDPRTNTAKTPDDKVPR